MALAIRLARGGRKARPFYRIVVADSRSPRDGRYIEKLGTYDPLLKDGNENRVRLVNERIEYWLGQGAQPSERVATFLGKAGIIPVPAQPVRPKKSAQSEKTKLKISDKQEKVKAAAEAAEEAKRAAAEEDKAAAEAAKAAAEAPPAPVEEAAPAEEPAAEAPAAEAPAEEKPAE
ncbi:MAG: 30S ribosomal protein S16 [Alphaproteobacteria bacterium]|nr:30S ribosomal protein S16 [Alphaproteobacteria bacterium]